ncbi:hypothetical protein PFICI_10802 [Pestalotiopsis fici W106-1]|uniref:Uncharacterized protein n=1 Tax=Pestalotiopsis fici (strain W106-1 / CGMCC3.15140) TaxID=1229662 RepID=W3WST1_PESFW|nr:uncharacterized protein PFICI_10802 [Pestalotiopsis fici W106-1]ETS76928.1 hypothetical protein PFICI_10802 [Pestalotiopsis fici W106-1]
MANTTCISASVCVPTAAVSAPMGQVFASPEDLVPTAPWRSSLSVFYSCISILILCPWTGLNLNLPAESDSTWSKLVRKAKWCLITICVPEYAAATALAELRAALASQQLFRNELHVNHWTLAHAFFANAGGFVLEYEPTLPQLLKNKTTTTTKHIVDSAKTALGLPLLAESSDDIEPAPGAQLQRIALTCDGLAILMRLGFITPSSAILDISVQELDDKSKTDGFAKFIAVVQTTNFVIHLVARMAERPWRVGTPPEYVTCIMVLYSIAILAFYWRKPQGINLPIVIKCGRLSSRKLERKMLAKLRKALKVYHYSVNEDCSNVPRIPYGRIQLQSSLRKLPLTELALLLLTSSTNVLTTIFVSGVLGQPWKKIWSFAGLIMSILWIFICMPRIVGYWLPEAVSFRRTLHVVGFLAMLFYFLCRLTWYIVAFYTVFAAQLPAGAYMTVEWLSFIPEF